MAQGRVKIGVLLIALVLGIAAGIYTELSLTSEPETETEMETDPAAAKAAPVEAPPNEQQPEVPPKQRAQAQDEQNPPHVRLSNVKMLHPPAKKDFSNVAAPEKDKPADEEEESE